MLRAVLLGVCACTFAGGALAGCATAGSGGSPDAGRDGSGSNGQPDAAVSDAPPPDAALMSCAGPTTCQTAMMLGSVSGDTGAQKVTASGHVGGWYSVRVTEDDSDPFGVRMRVTARLTTPASPAFDVFVYLNAGSDAVECAATAGTTSTTGNTKQVQAQWGESGTFSNGSEDGRTVSIEVRPLATTGCSPTATWQLEIAGN